MYSQIILNLLPRTVHSKQCKWTQIQLHLLSTLFNITVFFQFPWRDINRVWQYRVIFAASLVAILEAAADKKLYQSSVIYSLLLYQSSSQSKILATSIDYSTQQIWTRKHTSLDRGRTDRISLTHDPDLQSPARYDHDLLICKSSRSTVGQFWRQSGKKRTDGQTDGRKRLHYFPR